MNVSIIMKIMNKYKPLFILEFLGLFIFYDIVISDLRCTVGSCYFQLCFPRTDFCICRITWNLHKESYWSETFGCILLHIHVYPRVHEIKVLAFDTQGVYKLLSVYSWWSTKDRGADNLKDCTVNIFKGY